MLFSWKMLPRVPRHGVRYLYYQKYRKRVRPNQRPLSARKKKIRRELAQRDGSSCQGRKRPFPLELLTIDHLLHYTHPDYNKIEHMQLLCRPCHGQKDNQRLKGRRNSLFEFTSPKRDARGPAVEHTGTY